MDIPFNELHIKSVYRTGEDNLFFDFYRPVLEQSVRYDRAVGFFSSEILAINLKGLSQLVKNNGKMRLIIGEPLKKEEYDAIKNESEEELATRIDSYIDRLLAMIAEEEKTNRLKVLAYLVSSQLLEIKFAIRRKGMFHEKIGIVYDNYNNCIAFQGSANETPSALFEDLNAESISVYKSWQPEIFQEYGQNYVNAFESLWNGNQPNTKVLNVLSTQYDRISAYVKENLTNGGSRFNFEKILMELEDELEYSFDEPHQKYPTVPTSINNVSFEIREHQKLALQSWKANQFTGILQHATGSGKTITSIYALTKIFDAKHNKNGSLVAIISVPYIELAKQWVIELEKFNIKPIECFESKTKWHTKLTRNLELLRNKKIDFMCLLVVNKTLVSKPFQELIAKIPTNDLMFIGDECHRHASENTNKSLPNAYFKLGLSATPFNDDEDEFETENLFPNIAKERILSYYQTIVHQYSLENAIHDDVLTPYDYHIIPVFLTESEQLTYDELSQKINDVIINSGGKLSREEQEKLMIYSSERSRLLGRAENKLVELRRLTKDIPQENRPYSLFYTGEGKTENEDSTVINEVSKVLSQNGWRTSQFIGSTPPSVRKEILDNFKLGIVDALVAMKVLDEGIDVPACRTAYILASSKNPRQYVQRRGRVLRKFSGKEKAIIYDFVVLPNAEIHSDFAKKLKSSELERIRDFALLARNKSEIESILDKMEMNDG